MSLDTKRTQADLPAVHDRLKAILAPYREDLTVAKDEPGGMTLELPGYEGQPWGFVAATRLGARYVSFYLMGVYGQPDLLDGMSPELRRRMQGKSCFNFSKVDDGLFSELAALTKETIERQPAITEAALAAGPRR